MFAFLFLTIAEKIEASWFASSSYFATLEVECARADGLDELAPDDAARIIEKPATWICSDDRTREFE